jgi:DNA replication protein DnaC
MADVCPLCGGTGKKIVKAIHGLTDMPKTAVQWCLCTKSRMVSESPDCRLLAYLGGAYPEKINKEFSLDIDDLDKNQSLLVTGHFDTFRMNVKGVVMNYRFHTYQPRIYCCYAIDLLRNFYVKQEEFSMADVEEFSLLVFALGTKEKNQQLNTVINQVVYSRLKCRKPTWVYMPTQQLSECIQEYSQELEEHFKQYKKIRIEAEGTISDKSQSKNEASNFSL